MTEQMHAPTQGAQQGVQQGVQQVASEAKDKAADTAQHVSERAGETLSAGKSAVAEVADTATEKGQEVAREVGRQARDLAAEARTQLKEQAGQQHRKVVEGLRSLAEQLDSMAGSAESDGVAGEAVCQARDRVRSVADWLQDRDPEGVLDEVRSYARRRPGAFLLGAALAGVVAGRSIRGIVANHAPSTDEGQGGGAELVAAAGSGMPALPTAPETANPVGHQLMTPHGVGQFSDAQTAEMSLTSGYSSPVVR